ncbi:hypothetical protein [Paenibacillus sp. 481]|uniref:hypothetical protein n=1 Tax=Paenibacillus sp. 481 TaxID=2835869 RepID=UPI001E46DE89|nr:hypothetical protein [Paenibacillus sp. 481]UHA72675.1 hypothetical protein KIK04_18810 [Paenibacillus sp. 481]
MVFKKLLTGLLMVSSIFVFSATSVSATKGVYDTRETAKQIFGLDSVGAVIDYQDVDWHKWTNPYPSDMFVKFTLSSTRSNIVNYDMVIYNIDSEGREYTLEPFDQGAAPDVGGIWVKPGATAFIKVKGHGERDFGRDVNYNLKIEHNR